MRLNLDKGWEDGNQHYAGSMLIAHPSLLDSNFRRSVVLMTAHSEEEGALGVVVNRPMGQTLGEYDPGLSDSELADMPLYSGGPVASNRMILVAWKWATDDGTFKLLFGIDEMKAKKLLQEEPEFELRGFLGYSGWSGGQLEDEIGQGAWIISPLTSELETIGGGALWRTIVSRQSPEMRLLAQEPDDPSLN